MKQRLFEYALENNPFRAFVREWAEIKPLREAIGIVALSHALQIACGNGDSTRMLLKRFSPTSLSAVDKDQELIAEANERHANKAITFSTQDVRSLNFSDEQFDAVFDLSDLHNYRDWKIALSELKRVLKRGGLLILEELSQETFARSTGRLFKILTEHPYDSLFTIESFRSRLLENGFEILHFAERNPFSLLTYFTIIAKKTGGG